LDENKLTIILYFRCFFTSLYNLRYISIYSLQVCYLH